MESTKYTQELVGDYITLHTGKRFYPLQPRKEDITIFDIAHSLSRMVRYAGHLDALYTVGEHSLGCYHLAVKLGLPLRVQMFALMHDGSESIVCDVPRPVKQVIPQYKEIEDRIMNTIWDMVEIGKPTQEEYRLVKMLDNTMLYHEFEQLAGRIHEFPDVEYFEDTSINLTCRRNRDEVKAEFIDVYNHLKEEISYHSLQV